LRHRALRRHCQASTFAPATTSPWRAIEHAAPRFIGSHARPRTTNRHSPPHATRHRRADRSRRLHHGGGSGVRGPRARGHPRPRSNPRRCTRRRVPYQGRRPHFTQSLLRTQSQRRFLRQRRALRPAQHPGADPAVRRRERLPTGGNGFGVDHDLAHRRSHGRRREVPGATGFEGGDDLRDRYRGTRAASRTDPCVAAPKRVCLVRRSKGDRCVRRRDARGAGHRRRART